jgi:hypothetical protein
METLKNYKALAYCIAGVSFEGKTYYPSISKSLIAFDLCDRALPIEKKPSDITKSKTKLRITNIYTKEVVEVLGYSQAADYIKAPISTVSYYLRESAKESHTKGGYKIERIK